jgi:hypothetical protein
MRTESLTLAGGDLPRNRFRHYGSVISLVSPTLGGEPVRVLLLPPAQVVLHPPQSRIGSPLPSPHCEARVLRVASETITKVNQPRRRRLGWLFAPKHVTTVGRWTHAFSDGDATTLCGLPLELLFWERFTDLNFEQVNQDDRCAACDVIAGL